MTVLLREVRRSGRRSRQASWRDGGLQEHLIGPVPPPSCRWMADRLPAHDPLLPLHGPLREDEIPSERRRQRRAARGQIPTALGAAPGPTDPAGSGRICPLRTDHLRQVPEDLARGRLHEGDHVEPLEAVVAGRARALAFRRPDAAEDRLQPDAVLVRGEDFDDLAGMLRRLLSGSGGELFLNASCSSAVARSGCSGRGTCTDHPSARSPSQPRWTATEPSPSSPAIHVAALRLLHSPPSGGGSARRARSLSSSSGFRIVALVPLRRRRSPSASGPPAL